MVKSMSISNSLRLYFSYILKVCFIETVDVDTNPELIRQAETKYEVGEDKQHPNEFFQTTNYIGHACDQIEDFTDDYLKEHMDIFNIGDKNVDSYCVCYLYLKEQTWYQTNI